MKPVGFAILLLLGACAPTSMPPAQIPPPMAESVPKPPVSAAPLMWQPGYWDWTGSSFVWVPGQYVEATAPVRAWVPSYWEGTPGGWVFQRAHWQ